MRKNLLSIVALLAFLGCVTTLTPTARAETGTSATEEHSPSLLQRLTSYFKIPAKNPFTDQDRAAQLARDGEYDKALTILEPMYQKNTKNLSVARDYVAVLGWAGRDAEAVKIYEVIPAQEPDYVLASVGHSYRRLNQTDKALAVYRRGLASYPDNVIFAEGEIRCLADKEDYDAAMAKANADIVKHGERPEIVSARQDVSDTLVRIAEDKAVSLARAGQYQEALNMLSDLHARHEEDVNITRDYLSVLSWAGNHDDVVIYLYGSLPPGEHTDYVLAAVGASYRRMTQSDKALGVYEEGLSQYPDSVTFAEGQIRCLADLRKYDEALAKAKADVELHGPRPEIIATIKDIERMKPKARRHKGGRTSHHSHHHK